MPFLIMYRFMEDKKFYTCYVTHKQYKNFKELLIVKECMVVKRNQKNLEDYNDEMQKALDLAAKNDITHILKLSESA